MTITPGMMTVISLAIDAGISLITLSQSLKELSALSEEEIDALIKEVDAARKIEEDRRNQHGL